MKISTSCHKQFSLDLNESELKIIIEALSEKERDLAELCSHDLDEDAVAEAGNDLIELRLLLGFLKDNAVEVYGQNILNFSRSTL
ncbi:MAG: hypothetical protein ACR2PX_29085 [Endozoicomonas sp.]|uniref:hypothetical protein n=1 Tax=Endozoicomonas sp. TaxID=1892382 RepID=UPI003D9B5E3B